MAVTVDTPVPFLSFCGGQNDTDSPLDLMVDQVVSALNVEFVFAPCGDRRNGCLTVDTTGTGFSGLGAVVHLSEWFPTGDSTDAEWFGVAIVPATPVTIARRSRPSVGGVWTQIVPTDPILATAVGAYGLFQIYRIQAQASRNQQALQFFAYPSTQDRLHVWDGTSLRRA